METIFTAGFASTSVSGFGGCFSEYQMPPPNNARTSAAASNGSGFTLAPLPPGPYTDADDQQGQPENIGDEQAVHLRLAQRQAAILHVLGTNRDQVLFVGKPVHHVQEQIAIAARKAERGVG